MFFECECSFNKASYIITAQRNNLNREIIEKEEVLQLWIILDVIEFFTLV